MTAPYDIRHIIGGKRLGTPEQERYNPARPSELVARTPLGDGETVDRAVRAAKDAQHDWARMGAVGRGAVLTGAGDILQKRATEVAADLSREEGKTLGEARGEVLRAADTLRFYGAEGRRMNGETFPSAVPDTFVYSRKEPLGVVGLITPWNFPIAIPTWKAAPALIGGNSIVVKAAGLTPVSIWHLAHVLEEAGMPDGVFNVVFGNGGVVGDALVEHEDVAAVSFTGSTPVGHAIQDKAAARRIRVQTEMGGKNALVVLDDADPRRAAEIASAGAFGLTGQACTATSRIICTPGIINEFTDALVAEAERYRAGDGLDEGTLMGAVVSDNQLATDRDYLGIAETEGAQVITTSSVDADGLFFNPAVVTGAERSHRIAQEEVFGPVATVLAAADLDDAIEIANDSRYGLSAGLVTNSARAIHRFTESVHAGVVKVNRPTGGVDLNVPFGGVKESSTNTYREQGASAVDFFTWTKSVYVGID